MSAAPQESPPQPSPSPDPATPRPTRPSLGRALRYGIAAVGVTSLLQHLALALTGWELGIVALVIGAVVGRAVRHGAGGPGGRRQQVLAVVLTYAALVVGHAPRVAESLRANVAAASSVTDDDDGKGKLRVRIAYAVASLALASLAPLSAGWEDVLALLIILVALHEAWRVNRPDPAVA